MPTNPDFRYKEAEKQYLQASTPEEKLRALERMLSLAPKHKAAEKLRADLKGRIKRLRKKLEGEKKKAKARKVKVIKKEEMQALLVGVANVGKSSLLASLTNAKPEISSIEFTTQEAMPGTLFFEDVRIQLVDMPPVTSDSFDKSMAHNTDLLLLIITSPEQLQEIEKRIEKSRAKRLVVINKIDEISKDKLNSMLIWLKTKGCSFVLVSAKTKQGLEDLKQRIWLSFGKIRVYTQEPGKEPSKEPIILEEGAAVSDALEEIRKGLSKEVKEVRLSGPSAKFPRQKVSLSHKLADCDIIEFSLR